MTGKVSGVGGWKLSCALRQGVADERSGIYLKFGHFICDPTMNRGSAKPYPETRNYQLMKHAKPHSWDFTIEDC